MERTGLKRIVTHARGGVESGMRRCFLTAFASFIFALGTIARGAEPSAVLPIETRVEHHFATNNEVKIHYVSLGKGPLIVMIHGFPDFWLTWRHQMEALQDKFRVVAMDQRGYNLSDRPAGVENYKGNHLVEDVAAVIRACGEEKAVIMGHDWGGAVAWQFAMSKPEMTERLIILNLPHPRGLSREMARNPEQQKSSAYAREFQREGSHTNLTSKALASWVKDPAARARYIEAFDRSDFEALLNYYKANYPREPYREDTGPLVKVKVPVLMIHGLKDRALLHPALNDNWSYVEKDLTLVTVPEADHFVQQDAPELVTRSIQAWLAR